MSDESVESPDGQGPRKTSAGDSASQREPSPTADRHEETDVDALSAMTPRFNLPFQWFASRFFRHFNLDDATVEHLRKLESRGSIIYVMRYASRLDYFLFNTLFLREGIGLSKFANGIRFERGVFVRLLAHRAPAVETADPTQRG
jgi:glycerol-3-phosphate O-acyltransferase